MVMKVKPACVLLMMLARWISRHQQDVIEYLKEENKILREKLDTGRILLSTPQPLMAWNASPEPMNVNASVPKGWTGSHDGPAGA